MPTTHDPIRELSRARVTEFASRLLEDLGSADAYDNDTERLFSLLVEVAGAYVDRLAADHQLDQEVAIGAALDGLAENLEIVFALELDR